MSLLSRLNRDTSRSKAFSSITNKLVIFENILLDRGGGGQISTPIYRDTEPGVSCAKIGVQTVSNYGNNKKTIHLTGCQSSCTKLCPRLMGFVKII